MNVNNMYNQGLSEAGSRDSCRASHFLKDLIFQNKMLQFFYFLVGTRQYSFLVLDDLSCFSKSVVPNLAFL